MHPLAMLARQDTLLVLVAQKSMPGLRYVRVGSPSWPGIFIAVDCLLLVFANRYSIHFLSPEEIT